MQLFVRRNVDRSLGHWFLLDVVLALPCDTLKLNQNELALEIFAGNNKKRTHHASVNFKAVSLVSKLSAFSIILQSVL